MTTETNTTGSSPPVRLARYAFEEDSETGSSKEEQMSDEEESPSDDKRTPRDFSRVKLRRNESAPKIRVSRESHEKVETKKNTTASHHRSETQTKQKNTLVKKPIPKYNEMDYDDDFQMKISRSPVRTVDSGEHEDEDFNLDDYDFDINHDEFIGRGKPLEPRTKNKITQEHPKRPAQKKEVSHAEPKVQNKQPAASHRPIANKREERRAGQYPAKKAGEKEDYYDDTTTTQKTTEKEKVRDTDDEFNDENEESKEFGGKGASVRTIRSPWKINSYADKFSDKSSSLMSKVLSILPMFPEVPSNSNDKKMYPSLNPWNARS